jgi:phosphatidylglycerol:prolipoprotein diacylglycerol transferase
MSNAVISFPFLGISLNPSNTYVLFGHTFYWYGVIIACGFILAVLYCSRRCREFGITQDELIDILIFSVPAAIVGARIYYVIFNYSQYKDNFSEVFKIWQGGLAIYGAVIAAVITLFIVCRVKRISPLAMLDVGAFGLLIGQFVGRWGNFMNREAYGYDTNVFCRMGLTENGQTIYVHPTFLYESLWNLTGFILLHILSKSKKHPRKFDGQYFLYYVAWYGLGRMFIEGLRTDSLYIGDSGIRVSQLLAACSLAAAIIVLLVVFKTVKLSADKLWVNRRKALADTQPKTETVSGSEANSDPKTDPTNSDNPAPMDKKQNSE